MKNKYSLLKVLLVVLVFVIAGVIYTLVSSGDKDNLVVENETTQDETTAGDSDNKSYVLQETNLDEYDVVTGTAPSESPTQLCVHVCGAVKEPGVYYLDEGSRIHQAVELAGGLTGDASEEYVNLADLISDGQQIYIPTREEVEKGTVTQPSSSVSREKEDGLININTASLSELMTLPGIGESKAEAIIAYRENVSLFSRIEDITNVSGIKDSAYEKIKDYIKV